MRTSQISLSGFPGPHLVIDEARITAALPDHCASTPCAATGIATPLPSLHRRNGIDAWQQAG